MKEILKSEGIVINVREYKDNNAILSIMSENGLNSFMVRGVYKQGSRTNKFAQILTYLSFNYSKSNLPLITEAYIDENYSDIKLDMDKYNSILIIIEKLNQFYNVINNNSLIYHFFLDCINLIRDSKYPMMVALIFEIKLLYLLGISPILNECVICGNKNITQFGCINLHNGGFICQNCLRRYYPSLNHEESMMFKKIYTTKINKIDESALELYNQYPKLLSFIDDYYQYHLEFNSKVKKVLKEMN